MTKKHFLGSIRGKAFLALLVTIALSTMLSACLFYRQTANLFVNRQYDTCINSLSNIARNIEDVVESVNAVSMQMIQSDDAATVLSYDGPLKTTSLLAYRALSRELNLIVGQSGYFESIQLSNDKISLYARNSSALSVPQTSDAQKREADAQKGGWIWFGEERGYTHRGDSRYVVSMLRNINSLINPATKLGTLRIDILEQRLAELFEDEALTYDSTLYLIDEEGNVLSSTDNSALGTSIERYAPLDSLRSGELVRSSLADARLLVGTIAIERTGWQLVNVIPAHVMGGLTRSIWLTMALYAVINLAFGAMMYFWLQHFLVRPILKLSEEMDAVEDEHFNSGLTWDSNDEIGLLYRSFNNMCVKLETLINQVYEQKLHREEAELKALQAQINPHFLYNNLDTAYWMSRIEHADRTGKIVLALSNLFRLSIRNASQTINVKTELEHISNYITIQRLRFEDNVCINIHADDATLELATSRFVLQPLVENALYHGVLPKGASGTVNINIFIRNDLLIYTVEDDGVGANPDVINALLESELQEGDATGFAIRNVHQRIRLRCGSDYGLFYCSNDAGGITVTVRQPVAAYEGGA